MHVLLLGATGYLGLRLIPALISHKHTVTVYVRNISKLSSHVSKTLLEKIEAIVEGDATDSGALQKAITEHDIEAIIDVAGKKVKPWEEFQLSKIAKAISDAAIAVGKERGRPLRVWVTSGLGILEHPGTKYLIQDYFPRFMMNQHSATRDVMEAIPLTDLRWSILAISMMRPSNAEDGLLGPLDEIQPHNLLANSTSPPNWEGTWWRSVPLVGTYVDVWLNAIVAYATTYEGVADFLAEDLQCGSVVWIGEKVGLKENIGKKKNH